MGDKPRILAVTMGDPAGIGLDIILKSACSHDAVPPFVVYGDARALDERAQLLGLPANPYVVTSAAEVIQPPPRGAIPVVAVPLKRPALAGRPDTANAASIIAAIEQAVADFAERFP